MIFLKSLQLKNFLSHADSQIDFKENLKLLISGMSGSGKSSIVEAVVWCLYGHGRSDNKNLIKSGETKAEVTLILGGVDEDGEDHEYTITRTIKEDGRQSVDVLVDGKILAKHGVKETQSFIEKDLLKASYVLFINSIASPQDNPDNFVKQSAAKKKDLLLEIANTDNYDEYYNKIRELITIEENKIISSKSKLEEKELQLSEQANNIVDIVELNSQRNKLEQDIKKCREEVSSLEKQKSEIITTLSSIKDKEVLITVLQQTNISKQYTIDTKTKEIEKYKSIDVESIKRGVIELENTKKDLEEIDTKIHDNYEIDLKYRECMLSKPVFIDYTKDLQRLNNQINLIRQNNNIACPFCGKNNPKLEENINKQISLINDDIATIVKKNNDQTEKALEWELESSHIVLPEATGGLQERRKELLQIMSQLDHFTSDFRLIGTKNDMIDSLTRDINELIANMTENGLELTALKESIAKLNNTAKYDDINRINGRQQELSSLVNSEEEELYSIIATISLAHSSESMVRKLKTDIQEVKDELVKIEEEKNNFLLLKDAFSPKGIKTIVIDYLVPRLEDKINTILKELSDFKIQIDTQKTSGDGEGVIEGLFINIINSEGKTLEYSNYSGGEKNKIDYSIAEALANLSRIKFRILDESIANLDSEMLSSFMEVLEKLSGSYKQLIIISHIEQVKDLFDDHLLVSKKDGTSSIN